MQRQLLVRFEDVLEFAAPDQFHHDVGVAGLFTEIEYRDDVRMIQLSGGARLTPELGGMLGRFVGVELVAGDGLDGYGTIDVRIVGFIDDTHPATADAAFDLVLAE